MFNKVFNKVAQMVLVFTVVIGMGYSPDGATGVQARILGERAAIADVQRQVNSTPVKILRKSYFVEETGRVRWLVEAETY